MKPLLFSHIPKTAGTSFRQAAVEALGPEHCLFDYGEAAGETSPLVREWVYQRGDLLGFARQLRSSGARLLAGHFPPTRYAAFFELSRVAVFVREPRAQILSHFRHQQRSNGYGHDLASFSRSPMGAGFQSRLLGGIPLGAYGFVGVTERFAESLDLFNRLHGTRLKPRVSNQAPEAGAVPPELAAAAWQRAAPALQADDAAYAEADALLSRRLAALDAGLPDLHAGLTQARGRRVSGFAFASAAGLRAAVPLLLQVNGRTVARQHAGADRPLLRAYNAPRHGFVGFDVVLERELQPGDEVTVRWARGDLTLCRTRVPGPQADTPSRISETLHVQA